jgi:thiol-disulfide isomerase/thioredoxin
VVPSGLVTRYVTALQKHDFKTILDLTYAYQAEISQIRAQNPQILWSKLISEYYDRKISEFSKQPEFWGNYFEALGGMMGNPAQALRATAALLPPSSKWRITESRNLVVRDFVSGSYEATITYIEVAYGSETDSPVVENKRLSKAILEFDIDRKTQLVRSVGRLAAGDTFWPNPISIQASTVLGDASFEDLTGRTVRLSDYRGKVVLVNFWATWCEPCRIQIPWMMEFQQKYGPHGFTVLGAAMDDGGKKVVQPFVANERFDLGGQRLSMNYPVLLGNARIAENFGGITGLPTSMLISADGRKVKTVVGLMLREEIEGAVASLLSSTPGGTLTQDSCSQATDLGYSLQVDGRTYKVRGIGPVGPKRTHIFYDESGNVFQDQRRLQRLARGAWTKEFIVDRYRPQNGTARVKADLANFATLQGWQQAVDLLARTTVEALAAVVTAGESAGSMPTRLTLAEAERQLADPQVALARWVRAGLERSWSDYNDLEGILQNLSRTAPDVSKLETIAALYTEADRLAAVHEALGAALAPTTSQDVFSQYLKSAVSELAPQLGSNALMSINDVLKLEQLLGGMGQAFSAYKSSLDLALRVYASNEQVIAAWAAAAARDCRQPDQTTIGTSSIDDLRGGSMGQAHGIRWTKALGDHGAVFAAADSSRIEYPTQIPSEGTLEFWIKVDSGYQYSNFVFTPNLARAMIFSTDVHGGDVTWPGMIKLLVSRSGEVSLYMAVAKYNQPPAAPTEARGTRFRFGEWHAIGISYGSQGQFIMVDGTVVASAPTRTQTLGRSGNHETPLDVPTIGETVSHYWAHHQYEGGFEGALARFRVSTKQQDWYLAGGIGD